ncbi:acyltransferase family protein [Actinophytocola gossypii]|uniref:Acyltransferase family protein n=1 Tax=Actinophytocola gossypii TaxID=2812003 RepID=A0ABT2J5L6_9PSEU|nr:acyltransferase family protein [Actinophytocola gossypii]MCT2583153.1 acyltransferase family protein [Actinophytocola gossypii]
MDDGRVGAGTFSGDLHEPVRPKERLAWADVAKGACIVLVVLWHVIAKDYLQIDWRSSTPLPGAWGTVGEQLLPLRMPLFFAISGFFAANAVRRPWRVVGRSKVAKFLYLYGLWLCVHTLLLSFAPDFDTARATGVLHFLEQLTITPSNLWYLQALAVYFVLTKLTLRIPPAVMIGAAFLLSATAAAELVATPGDRGGMYQNLVFFLVGLHGKPIVARVARTASWARFFAVAVPYLGVLAVIQYLGARTWFGLWPSVSLVAVFLGVTLASLATRWAALTRSLTDIGRQTLPIYVVHMPLLALLHVALVGPMSNAGAAVQLVIAVVEPAVMTAVVVAVCLLLYRVLPNRWLFDLPALRRSAPARVR